MYENYELSQSESPKRSSGLKKILASAVAVLAAFGIVAGSIAFNSDEAIEAGKMQENTDTLEESRDNEETYADVSEADAVVTTAMRLSENFSGLHGLSIFTVTVEADGESVQVNASEGSTAADILAAADITYDDNDILTPAASAFVADGDVITLRRVEYIKKTQRRSMGHKTEYRDDDTIPQGEEKVLVEGVDGEIVVEAIIKAVDGQAEDYEVISREITKDTVDEVILVGTAEEVTVETDDTEGSDISAEEIPEDESAAETESDVPADIPAVSAADPNAVSRLDVPETLVLDENGIPTEYKDVLYGRSCAYTAKPGALMSTGKPVFQGYVAVNPDVIAYGSELYIIAEDGEVYGYAIAADTGGTVRKNKIVVDLFMDEYDDCIQWGNKAVYVYVLS